MPLSFRRGALALALLCTYSPPQAQQPDQPQPPEKTTLPSGIDRLAGIEPTLHIEYVRLILNGSLHSAKPGSPDPPAPTPPPLLIAQCTLRPGGKYMFEMFTSFGGATDLAFYPPWKPTPEHPSHLPIVRATITMDFLGYTHVKPLRRQWEIPIYTPGQYRFNPPGFGSANLEEIAYDLRYLLALPTLRLTLDNRAAEFLTTPLLDAIRKEPLCQAAAL
jgi:hypothetical protein